jgi:hypothetical protein
MEIGCPGAKTSRDHQKIIAICGTTLGAYSRRGLSFGLIARRCSRKSIMTRVSARGMDRVDRLGFGLMAVQQHHETAGLDFVGQIPDRHIADTVARQQGFADAFRIACSQPTFDLDADGPFGTSKMPAHGGGDPGRGRWCRSFIHITYQLYLNKPITTARWMDHISGTSGVTASSNGECHGQKAGRKSRSYHRW